MKKIVIIYIIVVSNFTFAQFGKITGILTSENQSIENVKISLKELNKTFYSDSLGYFKVENLKKGIYSFIFQREGYENFELKVELQENETKFISIPIKKIIQTIDEVVITGTLKEVAEWIALYLLKFLHLLFLRKILLLQYLMLFKM